MEPPRGDRSGSSRGSKGPKPDLPPHRCQAWLKNPRWLLVVHQDHAEAFADVNHANVAMLVFLHSARPRILVVTVLVTRHMLR